MITSTARIEANRKNAQLSTGPRTEQGKASSRQNALKHGLTATVVDLGEEIAAISTEGANSTPEAMCREWLTRQLGRTMTQIDRAQRIEDRLRAQASWRASAVWDEDRRVDAENLAIHLQREPSRTVARLRQTPQGIDWLIERWAGLARAAEAASDTWTDDQTRLAHDLLGTPTETRDDSIFAAVATGTSRSTLARSMIAALRDKQDTAEDADEINRVQAEADLVDTPTPDLARLRRYDLTLHRRLHWLMTTLQVNPAAALTPAIAGREPSAGVATSVERNEPKPTRLVSETKPTPPAPALEIATADRLDRASLAQTDRPARRIAPIDRRSA